jgi:hypothetical protein
MGDSIHDQRMERALGMASRQRLQLLSRLLGSGIHGTVLAAMCNGQPGIWAIKAFDRHAAYLRERDIYLRLQECSVREIEGHNVPQLVRFDDDFWTLEMSIVTPPFVLDFAGAYLDRRHDFSPEVIADWRADKEEQFGQGWEHVERILWSLERFGIFLVDIHLSNIAFHGRIP